ncbi:MAG TPA: rhomboid family intramembrane serine protease [Solirubrobacteraceae bacterium]|nr:rhomboid family intramembrane serine protease [Solirubrobacteraceae bacterium]
MTPTPVGMRCPECARQRTKVRDMRAVSRSGEPSVTIALIVVNVILFLGSGTFGFGNASGNSLFRHLALDGPHIRFGHDYYRLITGGFLHANILHIAFNMYLLWWLGRELERELGSVRFGALYLASLLAGSCGALIVTPNSYTVGASGAVFGLMGAMFIEMRARGIDPFAGGIWGSIGGLIVINLVFSFAVGGISIGGHIGGLIGGGLAAWLGIESIRRRLPRWAPVAASVAIAVVAVAGALAAAASSGA